MSRTDVLQTYPVGFDPAVDMTKRECMATDFVAAFLTHHGMNDLDCDEVAEIAIEHADALLKKLAEAK